MMNMSEVVAEVREFGCMDLCGCSGDRCNNFNLCVSQHREKLKSSSISVVDDFSAPAYEETMEAGVYGKEAEALVGRCRNHRIAISICDLGVRILDTGSSFLEYFDAEEACLVCPGRFCKGESCSDRDEINSIREAYRFLDS